MLTLNKQILIKMIVSVPIQLIQWIGIVILSQPILSIAANKPPVAQAISKTLNEDKRINFALKGLDPQRKQIYYTIVQLPEHGDAKINGKNVIYTPDTDYYGLDSFQYYVSNGELSSTTATVKLKIRPVNDRPTAQSQNLTIPMGGATTIGLTAFDVEGDALSFSILSKPKYGKVQIKRNIATYTPKNAGFKGNDQFAFRAKDKKLFSNAAMVNIAVKTSEGSDSVIQIVPKEGGNIQLPGVAEVTIPQGALSSGAVQVSVIKSPKLTQLIAESDDYKPLNLPQLQIKSSAPLYLPAQVVIPYPSIVQDSNGGTISVASYVQVDQDGGQPQDNLELFDAEICGNQDALCATLNPSAFSPVPLDPADPVIQFALIVDTKTPNTQERAIKQILKVDQNSLSPGNSGMILDTSNPLNNSTQTFKATVRLEIPQSGSSLLFGNGTPLEAIDPSKFNSGYQVLRKVGSNPARPHQGVDLHAVLHTEVKNVSSGKVLGRGREGSPGPYVDTCADDVTNNDPLSPEDFSSKLIPVSAGGLRIGVSDVAAGWDRNFRHTLVVDHGQNVYSVYRHLSQFNKEPCTSVSTGDVVALSGDTGSVGKPHLHFEDSFSVSKLANNKPIDPRPLLLKDMAQYLLPRDPTDQATGSNDIDFGFTLYLRLRIKGNDDISLDGVSNNNTLDTLTASSVMVINKNIWQDGYDGPNKGYGGAKIITPKPGPNGSTLDKSNKLNVRLNYISPKIDVNKILAAKDISGRTVSEILKASQNSSTPPITVALVACSFRLNGCHDLASWKVSQAGTITVDATTGSTGKGTVTSEPEGINCQTGSSNQCSYAFTAGDTVKLTSTPSSDPSSSTFAGWSGSDADKCIVGSEPTVCKLPLDGVAKDVVATFNSANSHWEGAYKIEACTPLPTDATLWYWQNPCNAYLPVPGYGGAFYFDDVSSEVIFQSTQYSGEIRNIANPDTEWRSSSNSFGYRISTAFRLNTALRTSNNYEPKIYSEIGSLVYKFTVNKRTASSISGTFDATMNSGYFEDSTTYSPWHVIETVAKGNWIATKVASPMPKTQMKGFDLCATNNVGAKLIEDPGLPTTNPYTKPGWIGWVEGGCNFK